jgi:hypothetical protein
MSMTLRLTDDENRVLDALQADLHSNSKADVVRIAIFALAKERGLLVERRFAQVLPPRMAARQGVPR